MRVENPNLSEPARILQRLRWGVFVHFLADNHIGGSQNPSTAWNAAVNGFDAAKLAEQIAELGAGYAVLTLGQNSGYYCAPNTTYEELCAPGMCSERDLIADFAAELRKFDKKLIVYFTSGAPDRCDLALERLGWKPGARNAEFQIRWENVIMEWSSGWGKEIAGWWIDGCYFADQMYRRPEPPNFHSFASALRAGNPNSALAFNPGVSYPPIDMDDTEDYTAGEMNEPWRIDVAGDSIGGDLLHCLSYLGTTWGATPLRFTPEDVDAITAEVVENGGIFSWDTPINGDGTIPDDSMELLIALKPLSSKSSTSEQTDYGVADKREPRENSRVELDLRFTKIPEPDIPGEALLETRNPWNIPIEGTVSLEIEPAELAADFPNPLKYNLRTGEISQFRFHVSASKLLGTANLKEKRAAMIYLRKTGDARRFAFPVPLRRKLKLPNLLEPPTFKTFSLKQKRLEPLCLIENGRILAKVLLARFENSLIIKAEVNDASPIRASSSWQGSCLEIFASAGRGDQIRQFFALPATPAGDRDAIKICLGCEKGVVIQKDEPTAKFATKSASFGYVATAEIPFSTLLGTENEAEAPNEFLFEMICAVPSGNHLARASLSGNLNAASNSDNYLALTLQ